VQIRRFERVAFVSVENIVDVNAVEDVIGHQLLPEDEKWSVAQFKTITDALQKPERALCDHRTLIVIDNVESILPDASGITPLGSGDTVKELMNLCQAFLDASEHTRLLFTSRQSLPAPFNRYGVRLGALSKRDAIDLVGAVLRTELGDLANEGKSRCNLGIRLIKLRRYNDARRQLHRAVECNTPFGATTEPWKTWDALHHLETACNNTDAAEMARGKAIDAYESYRRDGGGSYEAAAQLCTMVQQALEQGNIAEIEQALSAI
jgi:hypothetical protein